MKCPNCGREISDNSNFCSNCGYHTGGFQDLNQVQPRNVYEESEVMKSLHKLNIWVLISLFIGGMFIAIPVYFIANSKDTSNDENAQRLQKDIKKWAIISSVINLILMFALKYGG